MIVTAVQTPVAADQLLEEYGEAHARITGTWPTREQILVYVAQTIEETGGVHCYNWNVGNVKALPDYDAMSLNTREVINGKNVMMACHFSAFNSLAEGCEAQLRFLMAHYPACVAAAASGDPATFATAAKNHGYFTGELPAYIAGMVGAFHRFRSLALAPWETQAAVDAASAAGSAS